MRRALLISIAASLGAVALSIVAMKWAVSVPWRPAQTDFVLRSVLMVWPSVLIVLGEGKSWTRAGDVFEFVLSVGINATMYAGLGLLLWAGLRRSPVLLAVFATLVASLWWAIWMII